MSAPHVFTGAAVYLGPYDLTSYTNQVELAAQWAELSDDRFGNVVRATYPGPQAASGSGSGIFTVDAGADKGIAAHRAVKGTVWPYTICPLGDTDGALAYWMPAHSMKYQTGGKWGDSLPWSVNMSPGGSGEALGAALCRGVVALPKATYNATATGTAVQLGAVAAGYRIVAALHLFTVTGGSWALTIESHDDSGFGVPVTRLTFTAATAITTEIKQDMAAVTDTWWRAVLTKTGGTSVSAAVVFGIVPA